MEKPPKNPDTPDNVTPIARGYKIRFEKIRANVGKLSEGQVDSYDRLSGVKEELQELLAEEMALPEGKRDADYLERLRDGLAEVEDGLQILDAWFDKARAVEEEFAKKSETMAKAEETIKNVIKNVEEIKEESREKAEEEK